MADYLTKYTLAGDYDGIAFLTYAENFSQRYDDEFGYSDPIVDEYRAKYGKDIRHDEFDREAWRRLRGNHVTEFLRLLTKQLAPHGKKVAVCVHGESPDRPMKWTIDKGVWTAGNFSWSVDEWLRGGVVDEICLFSPASDIVRQNLVARSKEADQGVTISAFRTRGDLEPGVPRVMFLGREIEGGYPNEAWVDWPDEQLADEPVESLTSRDHFARRRVLMRALKGKSSLTADQLERAASDPDIYVRRTALRTIAKYKVEGPANAVLKALRDPENSVRCQAALALGELERTPAVEPLLAAAFDPGSTFQFHSRAVVEALKKMTADGRLTGSDKLALTEKLNDSSSRTRELVLYYFTLIGAPATPEVHTALTRIALTDDNPYSRELAIVNLRSSFGPTTEVKATFRRVMEADRDHAVQVRGAIAYAQMHARLDVADPARAAALDVVVEYFRQYGDRCQRTDREWGWRPLGNVLVEYGPAGEERLKALMKDPTDRDLSDRAWRILYLKQGDQFFPVTEEQDAAAHKLHPWRKN
ncbi:MAG: HEAT repeat domain-containing protein [Planctomycetota bacterium]|nr:HEAT repeat domain-containing protein [Planctomycetota bacterium]